MKSEPADGYTVIYGNENANHLVGIRFFIHKRITSAVRRVEFVSDRILPGCWCDVIVLNVRAPTEDKRDDTKDKFYDKV
jgi:hypothetical protein